MHRGHQFLIETALAACAELAIISYTKPDFEGCGAARRRVWLETLYPQAECLVVDDAWLRARAGEGVAMRFGEVPHNGAPDDVHREFCAWLLEAFCAGPVEAVFTSEAYGDGFAQALSDYFRPAFPDRKNVRHICVDEARVQVPVSGTQIRGNLYAHRAALDGHVYRTLIKRVALLGGESTGKSTLSAALASHFGTEYVAEYGRDLWIEKDGKLVFEDYEHIARVQTAREDAAALKARDYVMCDTTPRTTRFYCEAQFGRISEGLARLSQRAYDYVFLCASDFGFVQDGFRADAAFQARQQAWYRDQLGQADIPYITLTGSVEARIRQVVKALAGAG